MLKDKEKSILTIIILIIIVGIGITLIKGLNYDLLYAKNQRLNIYMENEFDINDIKAISVEALEGKKAYVQKGANEHVVTITAKTISKKQTDKIVEKINEKYEIEIDIDTKTSLVKNAKIRGRDMVGPYIYNVILAIAIFLIYAIIKYRKVGIIKVLELILGMLILTQGLYLSILAITRLPINRLTMPVSLSILAVTVVVCTLKLEGIEKSQKKE